MKRREFLKTSLAGSALATLSSTISCSTEGDSVGSSDVIATGDATPQNDRDIGGGGRIALFAYDFVPYGFLACDGQEYRFEYSEGLLLLDNVVRFSFGENGQTTFAVPDLRGHVPLPQLKYCISMVGQFPKVSPGHSAVAMLGEIHYMACPHLPANFAECDGSLVPIQPNTPLFSPLGNRFGGDIGQGTFGLPNLSAHAAPGMHYLIATAGEYPTRM